MEYIELAGKIPKRKGWGRYHKDGTIIEKDQRVGVLKKEDIGKYEDVGLLPPTGYVVLDFDNGEQYKKMLELVEFTGVKCLIMETDRGGHFWFKVGGNTLPVSSGYSIPLGLQCDIRPGNRNCYVVIKKHGVLREWRTKYTLQELDTLPFYFTPVKTYISYDLVEETTGRNNMLFQRILVLSKLGFSKEQVRQILNTVNSHILTHPLEQSEMDTILRDESFASIIDNGTRDRYFIKNTFIHDIFADDYVGRFNSCLSDNILYTYTEPGYYTNDLNKIKRNMLELCYSLKNKDIAEVDARLPLVSPLAPSKNKTFIHINDGVLDIATGQIHESDSRYFITNHIDVDYDPLCTNGIVQKTLEKVFCGDKQLIDLFGEMLGYCLYGGNDIRGAFFLIGDGQNGKSTIVKMLQEFLGNENTSALNMKDLESTFRTHALVGKLANISDDISAKFIDESEVFKKVVTGVRMIVEQKYKQSVDAQISAKLIYTANEMPRIQDQSNGIYSRLILIPFNATFTPQDEDFDIHIDTKLATPAAKSELLNLALAGAKRILTAKKFTKCVAVDLMAAEYQSENNNVHYYMDEVDPALEGIEIQQVYDTYVNWCEISNVKPFGKIVFGKQLKKVFKSRGATLETKREYRYGNEKVTVWTITKEEEN